MRALLIDVDKQDVFEVDVSERTFVSEAYELLHCTELQVAHAFPPHPQANGIFDSIVYGGKYDESMKKWRLPKTQTFCGNALICCFDGKGGLMNARICIEKVQSMIEFL